MRNETRMMQEILTSSEAQKIIDFISPVYGNAYVGLFLFQAIGSALDSVDQFPEKMKDQLAIQSVTDEWALEYWEDQYRSYPQAEWDIERRKKNLLEKMQNRFYNPKRVEDMLSAMTGYQVSVRENIGKNKFGIFIEGYFRNQWKVREFLNRIKPSHLIYEITMSELIETSADLHIGIGISEHVHYEVKVM